MNKQFIFSMLGLVLLLTGCQTPYISARTTMVEDRSEFNGGEIATIVSFPEGTGGALAMRAQGMRDGGHKFIADEEKDLKVYGDLNGDVTLLMVAESRTSLDDTSPFPTEMSITTSSGHAVGETTNNGFISIHFGEEGPEYRTDGPGDTMFELAITRIYERNGSKYATGWFNGFATNTDNSDPKGLFIVNGVFDTRIQNQ